MLKVESGELKVESVLALPEIVDERWYCGVHWLCFAELPAQGAAVLACEGEALLPGDKVVRLYNESPATKRQAGTAMYAPKGEYYTFWGYYETGELYNNMLLWRPVGLGLDQMIEHWFRTNMLMQPGLLVSKTGQHQGRDHSFNALERWV